MEATRYPDAFALRDDIGFMSCPKTAWAYSQMIDDVHASYFAHLGAIPGLEVHTDADITWKVSPASAWSNCGVRIRFTESAAEKRLDTILARYRANGRGVGFWVGASAEPRDLPDRLKKRGLRCRKYFPAMHCDLRNAGLAIPSSRLPVDLSVVEDYELFRQYPHPAIGTLTTKLRKFSFEVRRRMAQLPHRRTWEIMASLDNRPVGICTVFAGERCAGLFDVAVLESHRNKGIGRRLVKAACTLAREQGSESIILIATNLGYRVYEYAGFREVCRMGFYYAARP